MAYDITEQELYNRAFFNFHYNEILVNAVFEIYDDPSHDYMFIVFTENGTYLEDIQDSSFINPLSEIMYKFDNQRGLNYKVLITC
jgi:hypothetical protein